STQSRRGTSSGPASSSSQNKPSSSTPTRPAHTRSPDDTSADTYRYATTPTTFAASGSPTPTSTITPATNSSPRSSPGATKTPSPGVSRCTHRPALTTSAYKSSTLTSARCPCHNGAASPISPDPPPLGGRVCAGQAFE